MMKFRPLVRKLPTAPLDRLNPQETPGPQKTDDWGKVKVRRIFFTSKVNGKVKVSRNFFT